MIKFFWAYVRRIYYTGSCRKVRKTVPVQVNMKENFLHFWIKMHFLLVNENKFIHFKVSSLGVFWKAKL